MPRFTKILVSEDLTAPSGLTPLTTGITLTSVLGSMVTTEDNTGTTVTTTGTSIPSSSTIIVSRVNTNWRYCIWRYWSRYNTNTLCLRSTQLYSLYIRSLYFLSVDRFLLIAVAIMIYFRILLSQLI